MGSGSRVEGGREGRVWPTLQPPDVCDLGVA